MREALRERLHWGPLVLPATAAALLGIGRLLPETGFGLWLRLAAATLVVLLPGKLLARCLGQRLAAAAFVWSVALVGCGLALTFALGASIDVALAFALAAGAVALGCQIAGVGFDGDGPPGGARFVRGIVGLAGLGLGVGLWFVRSGLSGDAFFHLGRIRKLDALHSLSLHDVGEFAHGGLHPGYAFPLWHGWIALVARLADVDPTRVAVHEPSVLAALAVVLAFELGWAVFGSAGLGVAVVLAQLALKVFAPGHAGVYPLLWQPGTAATQLLVPAAVGLFFLFVREPSWTLGLVLGFASAELALVHPTYALFLAIPLAAFVVARLLLARGADLRGGVLALASFGIPMALAFAWLKPIVDQTVALHLGPQALARSLHHYGVDLVFHSLTSYNLAPARIDRGGSVVIAALVLTPLALLARRRRWSALVLGATVAILALELWPLVFPHFADAVSLSQARRAATFLPFAIAFAGGLAILARFSRTLTLAAALGVGIWLQLAFGGDFGLRAPQNQPAIPVWIALYGGAFALVAGALFAVFRDDLPPRLPGRRGITVALAALLFVVPVAAHGFSHWRSTGSPGPLLSPGLIAFLQRDVPARSVVFGDMETSYEAVAFAPVYATAVPPSHVANTLPNNVKMRRRAVTRFLAHPSLAVPLSWHAGWLVLRRDEPVAAIERQGLVPAYEDKQFVVFKLPAA